MITIAVLRDGTTRLERRACRRGSALAAPQHGGRRARPRRVLDGLEAALALLGQRRDLRELEVDEDGRTVWFLFSGDQEALANLLPQLIRAGCTRRPLRRREAARPPPRWPGCSMSRQ